MSNPSRSMEPKTFMAVALILSIMGPGLSGCGGVSDAFGFGKNPPDEFAIITKAPLIMPPDYTLRPPKPGAPQPQEVSPSTRAAYSLFSNVSNAPMSGGVTAGESQLLASAGALDADPTIREILDTETNTLMKRDSGFADALLFWQGDEATATVVDARAEAERIKSNQASGLPANAGDTPVVEVELAPPGEE